MQGLPLLWRKQEANLSLIPDSLGSLLRTWRDVEQQIIDNEGDITPIVEQLQNELNTRTPEKIDQVNYVIDKALALVALHKNRANEERAAADVYENLASRLEQHTKRIMMENNFKTLEGVRTQMSIRKCAKSLVVYDKDAIPADYCVEKTTVEIDKTAIKKAIESNVEVPGARLEGGAALTRGVNKLALSD